MAFYVICLNNCYINDRSVSIVTDTGAVMLVCYQCSLLQFRIKTQSLNSRNLYLL